MAPVNQIVMFTIDPVMHLVRRRAQSAHVIQQTPGRSTRSLARMSSLSSVPDITIEAPVIIFLLLIWSVRWELITYDSVSLSITNAHNYSAWVPRWAIPQCRRRPSARDTDNIAATSRFIIVPSHASGQLRGSSR
jgi:steroid 5-alpha reductase family enzyme